MVLRKDVRLYGSRDEDFTRFLRRCMPLSGRRALQSRKLVVGALRNRPSACQVLKRLLWPADQFRRTIPNSNPYRPHPTRWCASSSPRIHFVTPPTSCVGILPRKLNGGDAPSLHYKGLRRSTGGICQTSSTLIIIAPGRNQPRRRPQQIWERLAMKTCLLREVVLVAVDVRMRAKRPGICSKARPPVLSRRLQRSRP